VISNVPEKFSKATALEIWGAGKRFGMVPLSNKRIYWYATQNAPASDTSLKSITTEDLRFAFSHFGSGVSEVISLTKENELIRNDIFDFKPVVQYAYGNIVLSGDAAHATTPNLGQGACMAIEDAVVLANCLVHEPDVVQAFRKFELRRLERNTRIVNTSYSLGKVAQIRNPILMRLRNTAMRLVPEAVAEKQLNFLYDVSFA
jgi:2-polyprenyl-6-methoxyphenol hydroxylase-like FAD-dependent oxidoreductase